MGGCELCVWGDVDIQECRCSVDNELEDGAGICICNFCAKFEKASKGWVVLSKFQVGYDCSVISRCWTSV